MLAVLNEKSRPVMIIRPKTKVMGTQLVTGGLKMGTQLLHVIDCWTSYNIIKLIKWAATPNLTPSVACLFIKQLQYHTLYIPGTYYCNKQLQYCLYVYQVHATKNYKQLRRVLCIYIYQQAHIIQGVAGYTPFESYYTVPLFRYANVHTILLYEYVCLSLTCHT